MTGVQLRERAFEFDDFWQLGLRKDADDCAHEISEALGCYGRRRPLPPCDPRSLELALAPRPPLAVALRPALPGFAAAALERTLVKLGRAVRG